MPTFSPGDVVVCTESDGPSDLLYTGSIHCVTSVLHDPTIFVDQVKVSLPEAANLWFYELRFRHATLADIIPMGYLVHGYATTTRQGLPSFPGTHWAELPDRTDISSLGGTFWAVEDEQGGWCVYPHTRPPRYNSTSSRYVILLPAGERVPGASVSAVISRRPPSGIRKATLQPLPLP